MRRLLLLLAGMLVLSAGTVRAKGPWVAQYTGLPAGTKTINFRFSAVSENVCWALNLADSSTMIQFIRTTDGGAHWLVSAVKETPAGWRGSDITAYDADTAWVLMHDPSGAASGGVFKTTDGGAHWAQQSTAFPGNGGSPKLMHFFDGRVGVCIGNPNPPGDWEIYRTTDGGTNWARIHLPAESNEVTDSFMPSPTSGNNIWFSSGIGGPVDWRLIHSTDRGLSWTSHHFGNNMSNPAFGDSLHGLMARWDESNSSDLQLLRTTDGGDSWTIGPDPAPFGFIFAVPGSPGMYVRNNFLFPPYGGGSGSCYTMDGGTNWTVIDQIIQRGPASFASDTAGWCGSVNDSVYKWTGINVTSAPIPMDGLQVWLRADTGLTLNGSTVGRWADQSGKGHDAIQSQVSRQPSVITGAINGKPVLHFDGVDDKLGLTGSDRMSRMSLFIVFRHQSGGGVITFGAPGDTIAGHQFFFVYRGVDDVQDHIGLGFNGNHGILAVGQNIGTQNEWRIVSLVSDSSIFRTSLRWNGQDASMEPVGSDLANDFPLGDSAGLGGGIGGADGMPEGTLKSQCDVAEVLVYDKALADTSRRSVEDYLTRKYTTGTSVVERTGNELPATFALFQNYPNPFNPKTVVRFQVPGISDVKLVVYDILGREVAVLVNERKSAGIYEASYGASGLASGVYIYRLTAGTYVQSRKMVLLK
jgi:photosystem II stability/assembly factor-like uncharacterized protein